MKAKYAGVDPITRQPINVGDPIFYDKKEGVAFNGYNIFAGAGVEGGRALNKFFIEDTSRDPLALLAAFRVLQSRGISDLDSLAGRDMFFQEVERWSMLSNPDLNGPVPEPSALLLAEVLDGREDLRAELFKHLNGRSFSDPGVFDDHPNKDLDKALKKLKFVLTNYASGRDLYSSGSSYWTDFGAVAATSTQGMKFREATKQKTISQIIKFLSNGI